MDITPKHPIAASLFLSLMLALPLADARAEPGSLKQCQRVKDKIEQYTQRRRAGGSAKMMAYWQKKRNYYKELYSEYHCIRFRNELE
jgi:hypothetical protein